MIELRTAERRAAALGIPVRHVELDYVLHHLLAAFSRRDNPLVFRGGTALARVYWPDFRISEDLDFIAPGEAPDLLRLATMIVADIADETGLDATLVADGWRDDRMRATVTWTTGLAGGGELLIDVVRHQPARLGPRMLALDLRYPDLDAARGAEIRILALDEILANKWMMLDDREEPRDLFDLHWALTHADVPFGELADAHEAVYGYPPMPASIERAARLEARWEQRLAHQLRDLPAFGDVLADVRQRFDGWRAVGDRRERLDAGREVER